MERQVFGSRLPRYLSTDADKTRVLGGWSISLDLDSCIPMYLAIPSFKKRTSWKIVASAFFGFYFEIHQSENSFPRLLVIPRTSWLKTLSTHVWGARRCLSWYVLRVEIQKAAFFFCGHSFDLNSELSLSPITYHCGDTRGMLFPSISCYTHYHYYYSGSGLDWTRFIIPALH
jgi:hypothetical protein